MEAKGCIISRLPTRPEQLASPSGCLLSADIKSRRGVPTPLAQRITTLPRCRRSRPFASMYVTPVARFLSSTSTRLTRARVTSLTPALSARGQCERSVVDFAPSGQPVRQVPRRTQALSSPNFIDGMALLPGHQCQPMRS